MRLVSLADVAAQFQVARTAAIDALGAQRASARVARVAIRVRNGAAADALLCGSGHRRCDECHDHVSVLDLAAEGRVPATCSDLDAQLVFVVLY